MCTFILKLIVILLLITVIVLLISYRKKNQRLIDYALSKSVSCQLLLLIAVIAIVFGLLLLIMWLIHGMNGIVLTVFDIVLAFINPGSSFVDAIGDSDKIWAIVIGIFGMVFLSGLLISVFSNILERRVDKVKNGQAYYSFKKHFVIIGYNRMSIGLVKQLLGKYPKCRIVLQTIQEVPKVHHELFSNLNDSLEYKITFMRGNRNSTEDLEKLSIDKCREIFLLGESNEYDHDSLNIECLKKIRYILEKEKAEPYKRCNILFEYQSTYAIFQQQDLTDIIPWIDIVPFNFHEIWAQKVFVDGKYESPDNKYIIKYPPLDGENGISDKTVHLVIVGMSRMGIALGVQASHLCHFPNFLKDKTKKTRITFIDENADKEMHFIKGRHRHFFKEVEHTFEDIENTKKNECYSPENLFTDIEWHFIKGRIEHPSIQSKISDWCNDENVLLTIAICFSFPPMSIAAGLYLPDVVYDKNIPVLIQQQTSYSILSMLEKSTRFKNVKPFGMLDNSYDLGNANDLLPMMVKYAYDKTTENICLEHFPEKEIKENWEKWGKEDNISALKWSNRYCANSIYVKQRSIKFSSGKALDDKHIEILAHIEHNRWVIEKLLMGYRAPTPEELKKIEADDKEKKSLRKMFIHSDIRDFRTLAVDYTGINARLYDINIVKAIPFMLKAYETYKITNF